jgi:hypothetical protein
MWTEAVVFQFHILYFVSFAVVVGGSAVYMLRETHKRDPDESRCFPFCCCSSCCCNKGNDGSFDVDNRVIEERQSDQVSVTQLRYCPVHGRMVQTRAIPVLDETPS